jgi:hypothetical protein
MFYQLWNFCISSQRVMGLGVETIDEIFPMIQYVLTLSIFQPLTWSPKKSSLLLQQKLSHIPPFRLSI